MMFLILLLWIDSLSPSHLHAVCDSRAPIVVTNQAGQPVLCNAPQFLSKVPCTRQVACGEGPYSTMSCATTVKEACP